MGRMHRDIVHEALTTASLDAPSPDGAHARSVDRRGDGADSSPGATASSAVVRPSPRGSYRGAVMRTPDGQCTVAILGPRTGECYRVRRRAIIGAHDGRGRAPIGQLRFTVDEVSELLGPRFVDLAEVAG